MKILALVLLSFSCLAQDRYIKENDIENAHIKKGSVLYDTLEKGQGGAFRFILTDFGTVDTTKMVIIKYEAYQIDVSNAEPPPVQIDTIDSEQLVYEGWARHGTTSTPGWYKGTISYSSAGEARYTFVGTGVEVWGETAPNHGVGSVTVGTTKTGYWGTFDINGDGQLSANEVKTGQTLPAKIVEFKGLPQGQHTVTIKPVSGTILIDFIVLIR